MKYPQDNHNKSMFRVKRRAALDRAQNTLTEQPEKGRRLGAYSENNTELHQSGHLHSP